MTGSARMGLALLPLAAYFFTLGIWQSGKRPRVIAGTTDFGLLAFGVGGLIAFGPVGQVVVGTVFPRPSLPAWLAVASLVGLLAMIAAIWTRKRLVVYNVEAADLDRALGQAMGDVSESTLRTVQGFEDISGRRGVTVETHRRLRVATIEAHGERPEALIQAIYPALIKRLSVVESPATRLAAIWFALSCATLTIPMSLALLARPEVRAALQKLGGK